jgi:hypothetical protein
MVDKEIIKDFVNESKNIVKECLILLESIEGHYEKSALLEKYGNSLDRIMGGARTIALDVSKDHVLYMISDYAALCKNVSYKAAQIKVNEPFFNVCVALLIDASEMLSLILDKTDLSTEEIKKSIPDEFIGRLRWVLNQFNNQVRSTVNLKDPAGKVKNSKNDLEELLNKITVKKN